MLFFWKTLFKFDPIMLDPDIIISVTVVVCVMLLDVPTCKWTYHFVIKTEFIALFWKRQKVSFYKLSFTTTNVIVLIIIFERSAEYMVEYIRQKIKFSSKFFSNLEISLTIVLFKYMKCIMNQKRINIPLLDSIIWHFHGFMNKTKRLLVLWTTQND